MDGAGRSTDGSAPTGPPARRPRPLAGYAKAVAAVLALIALNQGAHMLASMLDFHPGDAPAMRRAILAGAGLYALLLAVPFVPGVEIGLAMFAMLGPKIAPLVYAATLAGLGLAYGVGRMAPERCLSRLAGDLGAARTAALLARFEALDEPARLALLSERAPTRVGAFLARRRHLTLALALNLPGNFLIGGGGGIALLAGLSRLYSPLGFGVTVALAVAPVPLAVMIFGPMVLR